MARRARVLSETDAAVWAAFASRIPPLPGRRAVEAPDVSIAVVPPPEPMMRVTQVAPRVMARVDVGGQPAGVDKATWQRFHRGKLGSVRKLDLHGMTAQAAFHALQGFLRTARAEGVRCVEVVTGRGTGEGGGVLRREFPLWLNLPEIRPMVLAAAHPHAANPGSVRVLLRRARA